MAALPPPPHDPADAGSFQQPTPPAAYPTQALSASDERTWAMAAHLSALIMLVGIPSALGPLAVWLFKKDQSGYIDDQGKEALNFQISALIYGFVGTIVGGLLALFTLGIGLVIVIPLALIAGLVWLVFTIIGALRASEGVVYRYPLTLRLVK